MRGLDRKQRDLLGDILSKIIIYLATVALVKQVLGKKFDLMTSVIVGMFLIIMIAIALIIVKEEKK